MNHPVTLPTILVVIGTRPEAIKLAPVIHRLRADGRFQARIALTGQHRDLVDDVLPRFGLTPDDNLRVMTDAQSLAGLTARLLTELDTLIHQTAPVALLVQGDTTSAMSGALAAFYQGVPVGHVEAGLRTGNRRAPFPEEINRQLIADVATWHFAPTDSNRAALLKEGVAETEIVVTGNTVVDALFWVLDHVPPPVLDFPRPGRRLMVVTAHRRESHGAPLDAICRAVRRIADDHPDLAICFPVHPNPRVKESVERVLRGHHRIELRTPMGYTDFIHLLSRADLILTDSGGIQEEAATLGVPVLVARDTTERVEALHTDTMELVGVDEDRIVARAAEYLARPSSEERIRPITNVFGDGRASDRIVAFLAGRLMS